MKQKPSHPPAHQPAPPQPATADLQLLDSQLQQAMAHHRAGQLAEAESLYRQVLQLAPNHVDALYLLSTIACQLGQYANAVELADQAILINPNLAEPHANRGNALAGLEQHQAALASFDNAIRLNPAFVTAHSSRGIALNALGQYQAAIESFDRAILLQPNFAELHAIRSIALYSLRQYPAALAGLDRAILLKPEFAEAWNNRGSTLNELHQYPAALESLDRAIQLNPNYAEAHSNRANALHSLRRYPEAIASCDRALAINPNFAEAWNNRGNSLYALQQYPQAQHDFDQAIRLKPNFAEAHINLGSVLSDLRQYQPALDAFDHAIQLQPYFAQAYSNRGNVLQHLEQYPLALESFTRALQLDPDCDYAAGTRIHMKRFLCDWQDLEAEGRQVEASIDRNQKAAIPFVTLPFVSSPALQRKAAEIYIRDRYPAPANAAPIPRRPPRDKVRIGYFSADFRRHAVSYLVADLFERHDRANFEIFGFSFGPNQDEMTDRISASMDRFVDVLSFSDREVADLSRNLEVDIAVDLMGLTKHHRPGIFAQRAAPIQVNYLGYPATMGADYIDYLIADSTLIPESAQHHYSEKIVYLPDTYQANDSRRPISANPSTRAGEGLPETAFVFCCFNAANKITPPVFDIWMRILAHVPRSVLWLLEGLPIATANLRKQAALRGIAPQRLIFAQPLPLAEHLARERLADLFLDTFPYNAHTTASDALWTGLPVLTRMGETFASRVAASLLRAINLPELITATDQAYEALAIELALNPERLHHLRERLARNRLTTPLFDTAAFTRHIESAYTAMHTRYHSALPPAPIHIPSDRSGAPSWLR